MRSSMKSSTFPISSAGICMFIGMALPKGLSWGCKMGQERDTEWGKHNSFGSQSFACNMSFARLVIGSDDMHHSDVQGVLPKVNLSPSKAVLSTTKIHFAMVEPCIVVCLYLKSDFMPSRTIDG